jgi:hypothetical protein
MLYDGIRLLQGTALENLIVPSGTAFPLSPTQGEVFFRTDESTLYIFDTAWTQTGGETGAVSAGTLTGSTLASNVTASSLTSVGNITSGTWSATLGVVSGASLTNLNASNLSSGTVPIDRIGTSGTRDSTTFFRGDGAWVASSASPGGSTNNIQYNNAGEFAGSPKFTWNDGTRVLGLGSGTDGSVAIRTTANAASLEIATTISQSTSGPNILIRAADGSSSFSGFAGGSITLQSGINGSGGASNSNGQNIIMQVSVAAGGSQASGSNFIVRHNAGTERLRITALGEWGLNGSNFGTAGQVIASNGPGLAPTWQTPVAVAAASTLTGTTLATNVVASSLTSVGTVTSGTWSASFGAVSGVNLTNLNASNLGSGTVPTARLGSGSASPSTFLRGDSTWSEVKPVSIPRSTSFAGNLTDRGNRTVITAGITLPSGVYGAGDALSFYNSTGSSLTITSGVGLTLRRDGTADTGNRALAPYGTCLVWYDSSSVAVISGSIT